MNKIYSNKRFRILLVLIKGFVLAEKKKREFRLHTSELHTTEAHKGILLCLLSEKKKGGKKKLFSSPARPPRVHPRSTTSSSRLRRPPPRHYTQTRRSPLGTGRPSRPQKRGCDRSGGRRSNPLRGFLEFLGAERQKWGSSHVHRAHPVALLLRFHHGPHRPHRLPGKLPSPHLLPFRFWTTPI